VVALLELADRPGTGTNALLLRPPDALPFSFGVGSLALHRTATARVLLPRWYDAPGTALDLDTPPIARRSTRSWPGARRAQRDLAMPMEMLHRIPISRQGARSGITTRLGAGALVLPLFSSRSSHREWSGSRVM
jgi:hypothetical protein